MTHRAHGAVINLTSDLSSNLLDTLCQDILCRAEKLPHSAEINISNCVFHNFAKVNQNQKFFTDP